MERIKGQPINILECTTEELYGMAEYAEVKIGQASQELAIISAEIQRRIGSIVMGEMFEEMEPAC